ncbi:MAG: N-acetyltransferase family protein [Vicinamibacterales bacterium]
MMRIRPATLHDLDFIVDGNLALAVETEQLQLDRDALRAGVRAVLEARVPGRYWIAEVEGTPVGQLLITFEWSDWRNGMIWWIQSVYVTLAARHGGVFRALYEHVRREAQSASACGLRLYVDTRNVAAQRVYAAIGMNGEHYRVFEDMFDTQ